MTNPTGDALKASAARENALCKIELSRALASAALSPVEQAPQPVVVTRNEAISFLEGACRNWRHVPELSDDDIGDVATELMRFVSKRPAPPEAPPVESQAAEIDTGDLPQSPWPASDWAIDRIKTLEDALRPFADIADFFDSETEGFDMTDTLQLVIENDEFPKYHVNSFALQRFYTARAALAAEGSE
jgi:hypothetical protein